MEHPLTFLTSFSFSVVKQTNCYWAVVHSQQCQVEPRASSSPFSLSLSLSFSLDPAFSKKTGKTNLLLINCKSVCLHRLPVPSWPQQLGSQRVTEIAGKADAKLVVVVGHVVSVSLLPAASGLVLITYWLNHHALACLLPWLCACPHIHGLPNVNQNGTPRTNELCNATITAAAAAASQTMEPLAVPNSDKDLIYCANMFVKYTIKQRDLFFRFSFAVAHSEVSW